MKRLIIIIFCSVIMSVVTMQAKDKAPGTDTIQLSEKQVASIVYAEMILKSKPTISIEEFSEGDYIMQSSDSCGKVLLSPDMNRAYFVNYENGNSDLIIPAGIQNSRDIEECRMVVYNRRDDVFYEIEALLPNPAGKPRLKTDMMDLSLLPADYTGMLVTFRQNGAFSWWAKYKDGKMVLTSDKKMSNDEYHYRKHAGDRIPLVYNPNSSKREVYDPYLRKFYNNPLNNTPPDIIYWRRNQHR